MLSTIVRTLLVCSYFLGSSHMPLFPQNILHFVYSYYKNYTLFRYSRQILEKRLSSKLQLLNQMDPELLQAHELGMLDLELRLSKITGGGLGVFTSKSFAAGAVIGHYYGTLM